MGDFETVREGTRRDWLQGAVAYPVPSNQCNARLDAMRRETTKYEKRRVRRGSNYVRRDVNVLNENVRPADDMDPSLPNRRRTLTRYGLPNPAHRATRAALNTLTVFHPLARTAADPRPLRRASAEPSN